MQVRRIVPFILAMILLLSGCGGGDEADKTQVGVFFAAYEETSHQQALLEGLRKAGFWGVPMDAKGDGELQKTQLSDFLSQDCSLVIVEPVGAAADLAEMVKSAQIPCVFMGQEPEKGVLESWDKLAYVSSDETQQSSLQGSIINNCPYGGDINGDGVITYAIIRGPKDDPQAELLTEHCDKFLQGGSLKPNLLATREGDWSRESGRQQALALLTQYGKDVEAILCNSDEMAIGAVQAVATMGYMVGKDTYVVGIGGEQEALRLIRQEKFTGTVMPDLNAKADKLAQVAKGLLEGTLVEKRHYEGYLTVTRDNIAIYYKGE